MKQTWIGLSLCCLLLAGCTDWEDTSSSPAANSSSDTYDDYAPVDTPDYGAPVDTPDYGAPADTPAYASAAYYGKAGVVQTSGSTLNLRSKPSAAGDSQVLQQIPNQTEISLLLPVWNAYIRENWYLAEYGGSIGYVSAQYIRETGGQRDMNAAQLNAVAAELYLEAYLAESWSYSGCFDYSWDNTQDFDFGIGYSVPCMLLPGVTSANDWYGVIHRSFSARYDSERQGGLSQLIYSDNLAQTVYFVYSDQVYLSSSVFNKGDLLEGAIGGDAQRFIRLSSGDYSGSEIWFSGAVDFSQTTLDGDGYSYSGKQLAVNQFSICFEDGRWKVGRFTQPVG